jgi:hypothetical protein
MIQKYRDAGQITNEKAKQIVLRDIIEPEVIALDYVFDGLQFGGLPLLHRRGSLMKYLKHTSIKRNKSKKVKQSNRLTKKRNRKSRKSRNN